MAKQTGWIKIHRQIMEAYEYLHGEPFCKTMAWIDLLMLANHKDGSMLVRGIRVQVKRGQVGYSTVSLGKRWQWSRGRVERFLDGLEKGQQIAQQKNRLTTLISIINYDQYQSSEQQNEQHMGTETDTNKKVKNIRTKTTLIEKEKSFKIFLPHGWDSRFEKIWDGYRDYRKAEGKGWYRSQKTEQQAVNGFWKDCAGDFETAYKMMDLTMRNRWTGLFPIKNNNNGQQSNLFGKNGQPPVGKATSTLGGIAAAKDF